MSSSPCGSHTKFLLIISTAINNFSLSPMPLREFNKIDFFRPCRVDEHCSLRCTNISTWGRINCRRSNDLIAEKNPLFAQLTSVGGVIISHKPRVFKFSKVDWRFAWANAHRNFQNDYFAILPALNWIEHFWINHGGFFHLWILKKVSSIVCIECHLDVKIRYCWAAARVVMIMSLNAQVARRKCQF